MIFLGFAAGKPRPGFTSAAESCIRQQIVIIPRHSGVPCCIGATISALQSSSQYTTDGTTDAVMRKCLNLDNLEAALKEPIRSPSLIIADQPLDRFQTLCSQFFCDNSGPRPELRIPAPNSSVEVPRICELSAKDEDKFQSIMVDANGYRRISPGRWGNR